MNFRKHMNGFGLQQKGGKVPVDKDFICFRGICGGGMYRWGKLSLMAKVQNEEPGTQDSIRGSSETVREVSEECLASLAI